MIAARHVTQLLLLLCPFACSLDDRVLHPAVEAAAGRSEAQGGDGNGYASEAGAGGDDETAPGGHGNAQGGTAGNDDGQGGGGGALVEGCADLDTDGIADCNTTLVETPSFSSDTNGWTPIGDAELTWDSKNALSDRPSGSAKLSARAVFAKAAQCVPSEGQKLVIAYANAFVEAEEEANDARTLLEVSYFASDDCSGDPEGFFETPPSSVVNEWTTIHAGSVSTETTRSVSITLIGVKARDAESQSVYFDNVMLKAQEL